MGTYFLLGFIIILILICLYFCFKGDDVDYDKIKKAVINGEYPDTPDPVKDYIYLKQMYNFTHKITTEDIKKIFDPEAESEEEEESE